MYIIFNNPKKCICFRNCDLFWWILTFMIANIILQGFTISATVITSLLHAFIEVVIPHCIITFACECEFHIYNE